MYTRCPQCQTIYRITAAQLRSGKGEAFCERCQILFNTLADLSPTPTKPASDLARPTGSSLKPPSLGSLEAISQARFEQEQLEELTRIERPSSVRKTGTTTKRKSTRPSQKSANARTATRSFPWGPGSLTLLTILIGQVLYFESQSLAQSIHIRPLLNHACHRLGCPLPPFKDVQKIQVFDRSLHSTPGNQEGFEFRLAFANQSSLPQAFPDLKLVLSELNGRAIAERIFKPSEYLEKRDTTEPMPVGKPFEIHLLLAKPSRDIGGFTFELL